jgi:pyridoxamine 5'-phosphate oxidase-like protein
VEQDVAVIPDRVVEVLRGPSVMQVGTRDGALRPTHAYVSGVLVHDDRRTITFFVTERRAERMRSDLEDNGRVALTIAQTSHEAYQLKGSYVSSRPASAEEYALQEAHRARLWQALAQFLSEEIAKPLILGAAYRPSVAITFRVEEVFVQTPGPRAGGKME